MLNKAGAVIYVGKAKNLSKRVASYFSGKKDLKTEQLIAHVHDITVTITRNEVEALLLELELIKKLQPKYNIIFKDAKSYPFIKITSKEQYPQLAFYRGNREEAGDYYGPYPSVRSAREGLEILQKIFKLRPCDNAFFKNRSRPCLQHQIKRCSAPCVGLITQADYMLDVKNAQNFLQGKTNTIIDGLIVEMEQAAQQLLYERAAALREQIIALRKIQQQQIIIDPNTALNVDVLGVSQDPTAACVHLLCIRGGRILGSRQYLAKNNPITANDEIGILETFILQHYTHSNFDDHSINELIIGVELPNAALISSALASTLPQKIAINCYHKGQKFAWQQMANKSALEALRNQQEKIQNMQQLFASLTASLKLPHAIQRIECFDISHTQGEACIGAAVVFNQDGPLRSAYRRYNVTEVTPGDDYAALAQTLERHYSKMVALKNPLPDVVLIDGGKGQLKVAEQIITAKLGLSTIKLIGIAKGKTRKIGHETLYLSAEGKELQLSKDGQAIRLIQLIRDQAHNHAITGHRAKRGKKLLRSNLEQIDGVGSVRRRQILQQFGGFQEVSQATIEELSKVPGISKKIAERIYNALHKNPDVQR